MYFLSRPPSMQGSFGSRKYNEMCHNIGLIKRVGGCAMTDGSWPARYSDIERHKKCWLGSAVGDSGSISLHGLPLYILRFIVIFGGMPFLIGLDSCSHQISFSGHVRGLDGGDGGRGGRARGRPAAAVGGLHLQLLLLHHLHRLRIILHAQPLHRSHHRQLQHAQEEGEDGKKHGGHFRGFPCQSMCSRPVSPCYFSTFSVSGFLNVVMSRVHPSSCLIWLANYNPRALLRSMIK